MSTARAFSDNNPFREASPTATNPCNNNVSQNTPWGPAPVVQQPVSNFANGMNYIEEEKEFSDLDNPYFDSRRIQSPANTSFRDSTNSSPNEFKHVPTNPFLDDVANNNTFVEGVNTSSSPLVNDTNTGSSKTAPPPPPVSRNPQASQPSRFPTAQQEKERLRRNILEEEDYMKGSASGHLPPPSYEEAAGPKKANGSYLPDKPKSRSNRQSTILVNNNASVKYKNGSTITTTESNSSSTGSSSRGMRDSKKNPSVSVNSRLSTYHTSEDTKKNTTIEYLQTSPSHRHRSQSRSSNRHGSNRSDARHSGDREHRSRSSRHSYHPKQPKEKDELISGSESEVSSFSSSSEDERRKEKERERRRRHRKSKRKSKMVIPKNVDTIDKLDVTGLFGGSFHHDGPFDAVTPHRNRNAKAPPVMAFPADGPNNSIGGPPTNNKSTMDEMFGRENLDDEDGLYSDIRRSGTVNGMTTHQAMKANYKKSFTPKNNEVGIFDTIGSGAEMVYGETTEGLGSSTFLDGAPAPRVITDNVGVRRNKTFSQRSMPQRSGTIAGGDYRSQNYNRQAASSREDLSYNNNYNQQQSGYPNNDRFDNYRNHGNNSYNDVRRGQNEEEEESKDEFLSVPNTKKASKGNKLLRRVKSLRVGRKN